MGVDRRRRYARDNGRGSQLVLVYFEPGIGTMLTLWPVRMSHTVGAEAHPGMTVFAEPDAGTAPVLQLIIAAKHSIDVEVYLLTSQPILTALETPRVTASSSVSSWIPIP